MPAARPKVGTVLSILKKRLRGSMNWNTTLRSSILAKSTTPSIALPLLQLPRRGQPTQTTPVRSGPWPSPHPGPQLRRTGCDSLAPARGGWRSKGVHRRRSAKADGFYPATEHLRRARAHDRLFRINRHWYEGTSALHGRLLFL
jgi:hypothetical protein